MDRSIFPGMSTQIAGVLEKGSEFEGRLCFTGAVRINGHFKGQIITPDLLVIGESAQVDGEVDAGVVMISGDVRGIVRASERVELLRPAVFRGSIESPSLTIDHGVVFEGTTRMVRTKTALDLT